MDNLKERMAIEKLHREYREMSVNRMGTEALMEKAVQNRDAVMMLLSETFTPQYGYSRYLIDEAIFWHGMATW